VPILHKTRITPRRLLKILFKPLQKNLYKEVPVLKRIKHHLAVALRIEWTQEKIMKTLVSCKVSLDHIWIKLCQILNGIQTFKNCCMGHRFIAEQGPEKTRWWGIGELMLVRRYQHMIRGFSWHLWFRLHIVSIHGTKIHNRWARRGKSIEVHLLMDGIQN